MKVLLVVRDLYRSVGGGQTVYRKLIEATPQIDFYYLREHEAATAARAANAHAIPLLPRRRVRPITVPLHMPRYAETALEEADQIARSLAGQTFDIVDFPDFFIWGSMLRSAFAHNDVTVGRVVLAAHGTISTSLSMQHGVHASDLVVEQDLERAQFESADGVYFLSRSYLRDWARIADRDDFHFIDPSHFVDAAEPRPLATPIALPSLYCVGRSEPRKGHDLFVELVRWLDPDSYARAAHIGPVDFGPDGLPSDVKLRKLAQQRGLAVSYLGSFSHARLVELYATPAIVILPVRYDTLNLSALEALFSGCPVALSTRAGACEYLDEFHPALPYTKIDLDNIYGSVSELQSLVHGFAERRELLISQLHEHPPRPAMPLSMERVYETVLDAPTRDAGPRWSSSAGSRARARRRGPASAASAPTSRARGIRYREHQSLRRQVLYNARQAVPDEWVAAFRPLVRSPRDFLVERAKATGRFGDARYFSWLLDARNLPTRLRQAERYFPRSQDSALVALRDYYRLASSPIHRCNFWLGIANLERLRGNELMAVTYELRILRLLGSDELGLLSGAVDTLERLGFAYEAEAARVMYGEASNDEAVLSYLDDRLRSLRSLEHGPFEQLDDRRTGLAKVSVIVSLYNAANKLNVFLSALSQQSLVQQGLVEIILIDSASPSDERKVVEAFLEKTPLSVAYARSSERESIQAAWNRGIGLSRAPYLVFLGVDETLYPEALKILSDELDRDSTTDWVMGNSLVTLVDENGLHKSDVMPYDRTGGTKDHVYLETCYLSWVGGMYRKSLHDRFGYYDESFRAAGDTEFKNRVLPFISVRFVDRMLGLFLNYPDGQTTASPTAEIEDLRAWYLHRTSGGVRYAFRNRASEEVEALLITALGYRKSYCSHLSSDLEYASHLADFLQLENGPASPLSPLLPGVHDLLARMRRLELADRTSVAPISLGVMYDTWRAAARWEEEHRQHLAAIGRQGQPSYKILNDNRYEQHSWLWRSI